MIVKRFLSALSLGDDATTDTSSELASTISASSQEDASTQDEDSGEDEEDTKSETSGSGSSEEEAKSETSNKTVKPQEPEEDPQIVHFKDEEKRHGDPSRYPDFVARLLFRNSHRRLLFIVEVKRLPDTYVYALGPKPDMEAPQNEGLDDMFCSTRKQIVEQVQLAFARYPEEQEIRSLCIVGLFFQVLYYKRHSTPAFDEYSDKDPESCHFKNYGPDHIFNQRFTGYNSTFLQQWRSAAAVKVKEIKKLAKDGLKGKMMVDPMIKYELTSDH